MLRLALLSYNSRLRIALRGLGSPRTNTVFPLRASKVNHNRPWGDIERDSPAGESAFPP
jgi:hypothetical protein